jgi:hypothetical protein
MLTGRKRRNTGQIQRRHMPGRQRPNLCRNRTRFGTRFGTRFEKPNQSPRRTGSNPLSRMGGSTRRGSIMLAPYAPSAPSVCHPSTCNALFCLHDCSRTPAGNTASGDVAWTIGTSSGSSKLFRILVKIPQGLPSQRFTEPVFCMFRPMKAQTRRE